MGRDIGGNSRQQVKTLTSQITYLSVSYLVTLFVTNIWRFICYQCSLKASNQPTIESKQMYPTTESDPTPSGHKFKYYLANSEWLFITLFHLTDNLQFICPKVCTCLINCFILKCIPMQFKSLIIFQLLEGKSDLSEEK